MKALEYIQIIFVGLAIGASDVLAARTIGKVITLNGDAYAEQQDAPRRKLVSNSPVNLNDTISTSAKAKLQILFDDGSTIQQGPDSVMVINEYVYNPYSAKENQADFKMKKGIFRIITDKITRLNPDRFSVGTTYGTIGIRGCDLMFDIQPNLEKVTIIGLHHADSVVVDVDIAVGPGGRVLQDRKIITKGGTQVQISVLTGVRVEVLAIKELEAMSDAVAPKAQEKPADQQVRAKPEDVKAEIDAGVRQAHVVAETAIQQPAVVADPALVTSPTVALESAPEVVSELVADVKPEMEKKAVAKKEPSKPAEVHPENGPVVRTSEGSGADWSWGSWAHDTTDLDTNGAEVITTKRGTTVSGNTVTGQPFRDIREGTVIHNLTGIGQAGAAVTEGENSTLLKGTSDLNVLVGGGVAPVWNGDFNLSGSDGSLTFKSSGSINNNGKLSGSVSEYQLNAFGKSQGMPNSSRITGNLVGSGAGAKPISGAIGEFKFNHAGGAKVDGVFGADINNK
ncbi:MAG: hypothetical protein ACI9QL_000755 [Candidatus Omnitrophota bacterium]|jgi:hypothetical protein